MTSKGPPTLPLDIPLAVELAVAAEAAVQGGRAALRYYGSPDLESREKTPGDPVTAADHAANDAIVARVRQAFPSDPILSEESMRPPLPAHGSRLWVVDPLDGTREFVDGIGEFAAMVGLAVEGAAVLGAVFLPDPGALYLGLADGGAWTADLSALAPGETWADALRPLAVPEEVTGRLRLARSRSHLDDLLATVEARLGDVEVIPSGSVGVKCCLIATGRADLYVHPVPFLKEWDTCAPEAVLRGAGGTVTDCGGGELTYGKTDPRQPLGIFAGRPTAWTAARALVRDAARPLLEAGA